MLFKKKIITVLFCAAVLLTNSCVIAFESSINSSFSSSFDSDFFNALKPKKVKTPEMTAAKEELKKRKIPASVDSFVKYTKKNDIEIMQIFVDAGFNVNTDFYTDYPIYYATKANKYEAAKFLLENGANPNLGFNTPLIVAIKNKNEKIARMLLEYGAKANTTDFMSGNTILYTALKKNQTAIARDLIEHGAKIDAGSKFIIENENLYQTLGLNKEDFQ